MPIVHHKLTTPYPANKMFTLVTNVKDYPYFFPYCKSAKIINQNTENLVVELVLSKGVFTKAFSLHYSLQKDKLIKFHLIEGPFKKLHGYWLFEPLSQGCKFTLYLEYEFANKFAALTGGQIFDEIANTLARIFYKRAEQVYGKP